VREALLAQSVDALTQGGKSGSKLRKKGCMHVHSIYTVLLTATINCFL
jgi:hypothetical protein